MKTCTHGATSVNMDVKGAPIVCVLCGEEVNEKRQAIGPLLNEWTANITGIRELFGATLFP